MRRMRWIWVAVAAALLVAACNGDDTDDEQVVADDCLQGTEAYRYNGELQIEGVSDLWKLAVPVGFGDASFHGAVGPPDRYQFRFEAADQVNEVVKIGSVIWAKGDNGRFIEGDAGPEDVPFVDVYCRSELLELNQTEVEPSKDRVNGVDALRFEFDKQELVRLYRLADGTDDAEAVETLPDNTKLTVWATERERWPVKVVMTGDAQGDPELPTFNLEINVTDLNDDITIEAPV